MRCETVMKPWEVSLNVDCQSPRFRQRPVPTFRTRRSDSSRVLIFSRPLTVLTTNNWVSRTLQGVKKKLGSVVIVLCLRRATESTTRILNLESEANRHSVAQPPRLIVENGYKY